MTAAALETVLRRDRAVVAFSLFVLTALAWAYLLWLSSRIAIMPGMVMPLVAKPWELTCLLFSFAMWTAMMVGMMTPSVAPTILLYARVGRQARDEGELFAATGWFAGGYLAAWALFSLLASLTQAALAVAGLLTPVLSSASQPLTGLLLVFAGIYEIMPLKHACLSQCQAPLSFIHQHGGFQSGAAGSFRLGLQHGLYCVGCCWALMTLLFVGGVMNVLWIAALSILVLSEKLLPAGRLVPRLAGLVLIAAGTIFLYIAK
jgi:predicted metal-binding membrane protein